MDDDGATFVAPPRGVDRKSRYPRNKQSVTRLLSTHLEVGDALSVSRRLVRYVRGAWS